MNQKPRVFVSHSSEDKGTVKAIAEALIMSGFSIFIDQPEEIGWGIDFCRENDVNFIISGEYGIQIRQAIQSSDAVLACLSTSLTNDSNVWKEEILVAEHLKKLVLCRIDDIRSDDFEKLDTGTIQINRLQSRRIKVDVRGPREAVDPDVLVRLRADPAFSFLLYELEELCGPVTPITDQALSFLQADVNENSIHPFEPLGALSNAVDIKFPSSFSGEDQRLRCQVYILSDLGSNGDIELEPFHERRFNRVGIQVLDDFLRSIEPTCTVHFGDGFEENETASSAHLTFRSMNDFLPNGVARQVPWLSDLLTQRVLLQTLKTQVRANPKALGQLNLICFDPEKVRRIVASSWPTPATLQREQELNEYQLWLDEQDNLLRGVFQVNSEKAGGDLLASIHLLCSLIKNNQCLMEGDLVQTLRTSINELDRMLSRGVQKIIHNPDFQKIERAWRGLEFLLRNAESEENADIFVLNVSKPDLIMALRRFPGAKWDRSPLFEKIYKDNLSTLGGIPVTCLVGDFYVDHVPSDVNLVNTISRIAEAANCLFTTGVSPRLLSLDNWGQLRLPHCLDEIFQTPDYLAWNSLRDSASSRFVALTAPRFACRAPYKLNHFENEFEFFESISSTAPEQICWANSSYLLVASLVRSLSVSGWSARAVGSNSIRMREPLPKLMYPQENGQFGEVCPTETQITLERASELEQLGVLPLVYQRSSSVAKFYGSRSLYKPRSFLDPEANKSELSSVELPVLLPSLQVIHALRCMLRDGSHFASNDQEIAAYLQNWLDNYVNDEGIATSARPLSSGTVEVHEERTIRVNLGIGYQIGTDLRGAELTFLWRS